VQIQNNVHQLILSLASEANIYIFGTMEPNCSIIAACLPCYGPLCTGDRTAESLVTSVRSVMSIRGGRSNRFAGRSGTYQPDHFDQASRDVGNRDRVSSQWSESQVELRNVHWRDRSPSAFESLNTISNEHLSHEARRADPANGSDITVLTTYGTENVLAVQ
jgi:hypothetical protein